MVRTANRIDSVPTTPDATVANAIAGCEPISSADDNSTAIHIEIRAARFADGDIPPADANR